MKRHQSNFAGAVAEDFASLGRNLVANVIGATTSMLAVLSLIGFVGSVFIGTPDSAIVFGIAWIGFSVGCGFARLLIVASDCLHELRRLK